MGIFSPSWLGGWPSLFNRLPWLHMYVSFTVIMEAFEQYLNYRQYIKFKKDEVKVPSRVWKLITSEFWRSKKCEDDDESEKKKNQKDQDGDDKNEKSNEDSSSSTDHRKTDAELEVEYKKNISYNKDKTLFSIFSSLVQTTLGIGMCVCFVGPYIWNVSGNVLGHRANEYTQSLLFIAINGLLGQVVGLPFDLYHDFVLEEKHGFNKKTIGLFVADKIKSTAVSAVMCTPIVAAVIWLIKWGGPNFYIWLWCFSVLTSFTVMLIYPNFIAPLFNKFEPLHDEELKLKINKLADGLNFPLKRLYQIDGSKRSSHSNAYLYGLWWAKRIVLYDTLLHLPHDRILAILGHELGHWKMNHASKSMTLSFLHLFGVFYLYGLVVDSRGLFDSFGYTNTSASIIGLTLFFNIMSPISTIFGFGMTLLTRKNEFEADEFSHNLGYNKPLKEGLVDIHKENMSSLQPDALYSWWHYSHPPLLERLAALEKLEGESKKKN